MRLGPRCGDVEIHPAVAVEIGGGDAHAVAAPELPEPLGHIHEAQAGLAIAARSGVVAIEPVGQRERVAGGKEGI